MSKRSSARSAPPPGAPRGDEGPGKGTVQVAAGDWPAAAGAVRGGAAVGEDVAVAGEVGDREPERATGACTGLPRAAADARCAARGDGAVGPQRGRGQAQAAAAAATRPAAAAVAAARTELNRLGCRAVDRGPAAAP